TCLAGALRTLARATPVPAAVARGHLPDAETGSAAGQVPGKKPHPDCCRISEAESGGKTATSRFQFFPAAPPARTWAALPRSVPVAARSQSAGPQEKNRALSSPVRKSWGLAGNIHQARQAAKALADR